MPYASDRAARLFYDDGCGPCRLFARAAEAMSHHRLAAVPLDAPGAEPLLGRLDPGTRFGYAHLAAGDRLSTGEALTLPLLGLTLGPTWEEFARRVPRLGRYLEGLYRRFWAARRTRGCGGRPAS